MVEWTAELAALMIAIVGIVLWVVTNWNTIRVGRLLKKDIDVKRSATEAFVDSRLAKIEANLDAKLESMKTVQINAGPMVAELKAELLPELLEKVESVRTWVSSKLGLVTRGLKDLGEDAIEAVGAGVLENADPEDVLRAQLATLRVVDPEKHPYAAAGLAYIKAQLGPGPKLKVTKSGAPPRGGGGSEF